MPQNIDAARKINHKLQWALRGRFALTRFHNFFEKFARFLLTCTQTRLRCGEKWSVVDQSGTK